mgnify:CR=1 FL=1
MTPKKLKNNFDRKFEKLFQVDDFIYGQSVREDVTIEQMENFFHSQIDKIIESTRKEMLDLVKENIKKKFEEELEEIKERGTLTPTGEVILEVLEEVKDDLIQFLSIEEKEK